MEKSHKIIIIGLSIVIIALIVGLAYTTFNVKDTQLDILGSKAISANGTLTVKLVSSDGTPLEGKKVSISVYSDSGDEVFVDSTSTDSLGKANITLENVAVGNYTINATFNGDNGYAASTASEKIEIIKEENVEASGVTESSDNSQSTDDFKTPLDGDPYVVEYDEYHGGSENIKYYTYRDGSVVAISDNGFYLTQFADGSYESGYL